MPLVESERPRRNSQRHRNGTRNQNTETLAKSHYETPIVKILVGDEEALFRVNQGLFQGTSFLAKNKRLQSPPVIPSHQAPLAPCQQTSAPYNQAGSFFDDASKDGIDLDDKAATIDLTDIDADYELKGLFSFTRDAFNIFIRHLNDALPQTPRSQEDCQTLFKSYHLAALYDDVALQNNIIDALQRFYIQNTIPISDITYLIEHWGDRVDCCLAGYLVAQAGYEMAVDWPGYRAENNDLVALFQSGHNIVLEQLFQAAMQHTKPLPTADPAKHKRDWRLQPS